MVNEFSTISAESEMGEMVQMSAAEITDANAWFDARNEADYWMDSMNEE
jgi:hypothetical protein